MESPPILGEEVLIHVGVDTVEIKGTASTALVGEQDQHVEVGQPLMTFDLDKVMMRVILR